MPLRAPVNDALRTLGVLLIGVVGGYGGAYLRCWQLRKELDLAEADHEGYDLRIKKLEGRTVRAQQQQTAVARGDLEAIRLAALLNRPRNGTPEPEDDATLLQKVFGEPK